MIEKILYEKLSEIATTKPDSYNGTEETYIVFYVADNRGSLYCDDSPERDVLTVQVHFFTPLGKMYHEEKRKIRKALYDIGLTYPTITILTEEENETIHIVFECEIDEESEV